MKRVEIKLENRHLNFAAQLSFTRETTLRFALSFFFFISLLKDSHSSFIIFFFYFSSILINFSSKIFIRFLYNLNILYKIFRTQVCHILLNRNHIFVMIYIFIYFCANYVYWQKFVFKTDFIFSHGAFYLRGETWQVFTARKMKLEEIFMSQMEIKKLFSSIVPLWSFIFFLRENIFLFGKKNLYIS